MPERPWWSDLARHLSNEDDNENGFNRDENLRVISPFDGDYPPRRARWWSQPASKLSR